MMKKVFMGKSGYIYILTVILSIIMVTSPALGATAWELEKSEAGIEVYTRIDPGSGLKEFRGETILPETRLSTIMALMKDFDAYPQWVYNCVEAKVIKEINWRERITGMITRAPWPIYNRDTVSYSIVTQDPKTFQITIKIIGVPNYRPETKGNVRVPEVKGFWTFTPLASGDVKVVYQLHADPGGSIPYWLANVFVVDMPLYTLEKMREMVKKPKYQNATVEGIKEPKE